MIHRGLLVLLLGATALNAQVTSQRLLRAQQEPQNWLTHSGGYHGHRHSPLTQITPANAKNLELQWVWQARSLEKFEATPLVVDGIMYTVQMPNDIVALDATSGRVFWIYNHRPAANSRPCCGRVNRGVAILGDTLYMTTIDAKLLAIDAKNGALRWSVEIAKPESGYALTVAPLVIKDKVVIGTAGAEYGIRGFVAAYDANTGKEAWRFYTIAGPGEPGHETWPAGTDAWKHGGGSIWVTGSYDPETNLTYWGTGNPGPDWNSDARAGDNLYSDSVVALDADTGKLKWHYQFTPHDDWDYDSTQVPVLADLQWQGRPRKVLLFANRNGFFYVLDRTNGQFLLGKPFARVTWASHIDETGRPVRVPGKEPTREGVLVYPGVQGATNWYSPSFSPRTGLMYVPTWDDYSSSFVKLPVTYEEGKSFTGGAPRSIVPSIRFPQVNNRSEADGYGAVRAIDPLTGERKWEFKMSDVTDSGILSTAGDVVFSGGREGYFFALNARTGEMLWKASVGGGVASGPMSYAINGRQYISVAAGAAIFTYALRQ
jgi:alcohol dehydrogenase (cytochrome c)